MIKFPLKDSIKKIQDEDVVIEWTEGLTDGAKDNYLKALAEFTIVTKKTPQELLDIAFREKENRTPPWESKMKDWFKAYDDHCKELERSKATRNNRRGIIRGFFHFYELETPKILTKRKKTDPLKIKNKRPALTKNKIKKALAAARTLRIKAIILTQASSGLAEADVVNLKIKDFYNGLIEIADGKEICKLHLNREKTGKEFTTFLSYEAVEAIKNYIKSERKFEDSPYLFQKLYLMPGSNSDPMLNRDLIEKEYRVLNGRMKHEQKEKGVYRPITSHMMRKFFNTQLTNSGMSYEPRKHMMGHVIPGVDDSYYLNNQDELQELYLKYMGKLTVNPTKTLTVESEEFRELKKQLDDGKKESEIKDKKIDKLEEKQAIMEKMLQEIMEKQIK
jgi:integrase